MEDKEFRIEVLVTTMHQHDMTKYEQMNLQTDAVIANQTDYNGYEEREINGYRGKMISSETRGLSRNRNIALALSSGDLLVFADDDMVFKDGYEKLIRDEFQTHPEAEAIMFAVNIIALGKGKIATARKKITEFTRATRKFLGAYGVCGLAIKADTLKRSCLCFHERFGAGTENYCGEDTIFLQKILCNKVPFYLSPVIIADIDQSESTWFDGFTKKRFYVNGRILAACYPHVSRLLAVRSAYRFSKRQKSMRFFAILKAYWKGIKDYEHHNF